MADDEDYPSLSDVGDCYLTNQEDAIEENVLQGLEDRRKEECHWSLSLSWKLLSEIGKEKGRLTLTKRSLLIVSEDVVDDALAMLLLNKHRASLKVCAIKAPGFGENRRANLEDLANL